MKRSEIDSAIARSIASAKTFGIGLPMWADWSPEQFDSTTVGIRDQKLGWKVVDFGLGDFQHCGLVLFVLCNPLTDDVGEPLSKSSFVGTNEYPPTSFSRKYLFVQAGQTEPHHFHRQKTVKLVTLVAGDRVRFELAWAEGDKTLSQKSVRVQVDGVWHDLPANGELFLRAGETILLPSELSHIIQVMPGDSDVILQETSTANNDRKDNIFPFIAPTSSPIEEDSKPRYQLLDEQHDLSGSKT